MAVASIATAQAKGGLVDFFLKLSEGIEGESKDHKHAKEIRLESYSFGADQAHSAQIGAAHAAGLVRFKNFSFVKHVDKSSPKLLEHCATGKPITTATLTCRKAGGEQQDYMTIKLSEVLISSFSIGEENEDGYPTDSGSFTFAKIEFEYKEQKPDGTLGGAIKFGWDLKENKKL